MKINIHSTPVTAEKIKSERLQCRIYSALGFGAIYAMGFYLIFTKGLSVSLPWLLLVAGMSMLLAKISPAKSLRDIHPHCYRKMKGWVECPVVENYCNAVAAQKRPLTYGEYYALEKHADNMSEVLDGVETHHKPGQPVAPIAQEEAEDDPAAGDLAPKFIKLSDGRIVPASEYEANAKWVEHAYPLQQITIQVQGTRHSHKLIEELEIALSRIKAGDLFGYEHDDDFGYRFQVIKESQGPSFFAGTFSHRDTLRTETLGKRRNGSGIETGEPSMNIPSADNKGN